MFPTSTYRRLREWWKDPFRARGNFAEHVTIFLTIVLAVVGGLQAAIYWQQKKIMESSGPQTQQLIDAANTQACAARQIAAASEKNAAAAESFSISSGEINRGISDAVGKLQTQAEKMDAARIASEKQSADSLQATIANFHQDQRAWIGVAQMHLISFESGKPMQGDITLFNSGKTPAIHASSGLKAVGVISTTASNQFIEENVNKYLEDVQLNPMEAIPPQGTHVIHILDNAPVEDAQYQRVLKGIGDYYVVGKVSFIDVSRRQQWTTFCLRVSYSANGMDWFYCKSGNDMSYQEEK
jgi:hypothetical protein